MTYPNMEQDLVRPLTCETCDRAAQPGFSFCDHCIREFDQEMALDRDAFDDDYESKSVEERGQPFGPEIVRDFTEEERRQVAADLREERLWQEQR